MVRVRGVALWRCGLGGFSAGFGGWVGCFASDCLGWVLGLGLVWWLLWWWLL